MNPEEITKLRKELKKRHPSPYEVTELLDIAEQVAYLAADAMLAAKSFGGG